MDKADKALIEIAKLGEQARSDFQFVTLGMKELATSMRGMASTMEQIENRMVRQEQRFDKILLAVQAALEGARAVRPTLDEFIALEARVESLEKRPPAA